jgi:hypothetical protein
MEAIGFERAKPIRQETVPVALWQSGDLLGQRVRPRFVCARLKVSGHEGYLPW